MTGAVFPKTISPVEGPSTRIVGENPKRRGIVAKDVVQQALSGARTMGSLEQIYEPELLLSRRRLIHTLANTGKADQLAT